MPDTPIYKVAFLRHGESVGNAEARFQGRADFPLTDRGRAQAQALADRWLAEGVTFDRCISSPLLRARQTAEIICTALHLPLEFDPAWMEIDNGLLEGMSEEEACLRLPRPAFMTPYDHYGQTGESRWQLYLRAGGAIQQLLERSPGSYLIASHGGILNMAMYAILGIAPQADFQGPRFMFHNTTFATFTYEPEHYNWRLLTFDGRPHWKEEAA